MEELFNQERITLKDFVPPVVFKIARKLDGAKLTDKLANLGEPYLTEIVVGLMVLSSILFGVIVSSTLPSTVAQLTAALKGKYNVKLTAEAYQKIYSLEVQRLQAKNQDNIYEPYKQGAVLGIISVEKDYVPMQSDDILEPKEPYDLEDDKEYPVDESPAPESSLFDIWEDDKPGDLTSAESTLANTRAKPKGQELSAQVLGAVDNSSYNAADYYSYF